MSKAKPMIQKTDAAMPAILVSLGLMAGMAVLTIVLAQPLAPGMTQVILFYILIFLGGGVVTAAVFSRWLDRHDPCGEDQL